jgi:ATP adenylyltransferase
MRYVGGDRSEPGCIFCNRLRSDDDRASLILHRGRHAFVIMNLFPYNTGHIMIVPNVHVPSPEALDDEMATDMARLVPRMLRALRGALNPAGFNLGTNVGDVAGAGIAAHLHQHVVPRWQGDANFMPILANTMVLPEMIPVTYAKIRAELARESSQSVTILAVDPKQATILIDLHGDQLRLPRISLTDEPVWRTSATFLSEVGVLASLSGWAGPGSTSPAGTIALAFEAEPDSAPQGALQWKRLVDAKACLPENDATLFAGAIRL